MQKRHKLKPQKENRKKNQKRIKKEVVVEYMLCPLTPKRTFTTTTYFYIMIEFNAIWQLLVNHGASLRKEEGTRRYWLTLTPEQQHAAFTNISTKLSQGRFVHFDPIQAIKENIRSYQLPQPEFLRGDEDGELVQVLYNGLYKICTPETAEAFGLQIIKIWKH